MNASNSFLYQFLEETLLLVYNFIYITQVYIVRQTFAAQSHSLVQMTTTRVWS